MPSVALQRALWGDPSSSAPRACTTRWLRRMSFAQALARLVWLSLVALAIVGLRG
jgi:hypothetical protein